MRTILSSKKIHAVRCPLRAALLLLFVGLLLPGCEDDPILDPTGDDSGGGSYGRMSTLSSRRPAEIRGTNPVIF